MTQQAMMDASLFTDASVEKRNQSKDYTVKSVIDRGELHYR
jgi:hypothetical protein